MTGSMKPLSPPSASPPLLLTSSSSQMSLRPSQGVRWDNAGEGCWQKLRRAGFDGMSDAELENAAHEDLLFDPEPYFALAERKFEEKGDELRWNTKDRFKQAFDLQAKRERYTLSSSVISSISDFLMRKLTRYGLDVICSKLEHRDLELVREVTGDPATYYSDADVQYLGRYGGWEDIPLLLSMATKNSLSQGQVSILSILNDNSKNWAIARCLYRIGEDRLANVLTVQAPSAILSRFIFVIPKEQLAALNDKVILALLRSDSDQTRKAGALRCIDALSKDRLASLLSQYTREVAGFVETPFRLR
jgi:hypothetical protein